MKSVDQVLLECRDELIALLTECKQKNNDLKIKQALKVFLDSLEEKEEINLPIGAMDSSADTASEEVARVTKAGKRKRRTKAEMQAARLAAEDDSKKPLTAREIAIDEANKREAPNQEAAIALAIKEVIKPNIGTVGADGFHHFYVNLNRGGINLPTSGNKWIAGLKAAGIACDEKLFTCIIAGQNVPAGQMKISF